MQEPFYFVFVLVWYFGILGFSKNMIFRNVEFFLISMTLVAFAAFRSVGVGSDDAAYLDIFQRVPPLFQCKEFLCGYVYERYNIEIGFFFLLSLIKQVTNAHYFLFGAIALLSVILNLASIRIFFGLLAPPALIYLSHFFLAKELNAIRMGLASAVLIYASTFLLRKKFLLTFFLLAIAVSIHVTSVIFIFPLILVLWSPSRKIVVVLLGGALAFRFLVDVKSIFSKLESFGFVGYKLMAYVNADIYSYSMSPLDLVNIRNLLIVFTSLLCWRRLSNIYRHFSFIFYFFMSAVLFRFIFGDFAIVAGRGYAVISMFEFILIPMLSFGLLGRAGAWVVTGYALLALWLNLNVNAGWSAGVWYINDFL